MFRYSNQTWKLLSKRVYRAQSTSATALHVTRSGPHNILGLLSAFSTERVVFNDALSGVRIQPSSALNKEYPSNNNSRSSALYTKHVLSEISKLPQSSPEWEALARRCSDDHMYEAAREVVKAAHNKGIALGQECLGHLFSNAVGNYDYGLAGDVILELMPLEGAARLGADAFVDIVSDKVRRRDWHYLSKLIVSIVRNDRMDLAALLNNHKVDVETRSTLNSQQNKSPVNIDLNNVLLEIIFHANAKGTINEPIFRFFGLLLSQASAKAKEDLIAKFVSEFSGSSKFSTSQRIVALGCISDSISHMWDLSAIDAVHAAVKKEWSQAHSTAPIKDNLPLPSEYEKILSVMWSTTQYRYAAVNRESPEEFLNVLSEQCTNHYEALVDFIRSNAWALTFNVPSGAPRRQFRILCDALGLYHRVLPNELASDLIRMKVYKEGLKDRYERRDIVDPPGLEDLITQHRFHEDNSPMRIAPVPSDWIDAAMTLCSAQPDMAAVVLTRIFRDMGRRGLNDVSWALEWSKVLYRIDGSIVPASILDEMIQMCKSSHDVYGLLEVLYVCRERGVRLSSASWHAAIETAWAAGLRHLPRENWSRAFIQVIDILKQCNGKLDNASIRVLMRYLAIKRDREDVFLYKIIDRLYRDHSQDLNHVESTILTVLLFRRNSALRKSKILEIPQPMFTSSRFLTLHEHAHEKLYNMLFEQSKDLPEGFFQHFSSVWRNVHSPSGRADLFGIIHDLLYDPNIAHMISIPTYEELRDSISHVAIFAAFQIAHHDKEYRKSFELLHRLSTLYREFELNVNKGREFEHNCPRRDHPEEPISHFKYGWIDSDEDGDMAEDLKSQMSDKPKSSTRNRGSKRNNASTTSTATTAGTSEESDGLDMVGEGEALSRDDFATEEGFLRARAQKNAIRNRVRPVDVRIPDQELRTDPYRNIERLRFIPKR